MFRTVPVRAKFSNEESSFWEVQCKASNSLYNSALYQYKQAHYQKLEAELAFSSYWRRDDYRAGWKLRQVTATNYYEIDKLLKHKEHYKLMAAQSAQQTLKDVQEAITSFNKLVDLFFNGEADRPKLPRYRKSGGLHSVTFPLQALTLKNGYVYPSISKLSKRDVLGEIKFELPEFVDFNLLKEVRVRPCRGEFWIYWVCDDCKPELKANPRLDYAHYLAIDHGVKNWVSAVTTKGRSFIVNAKPLKQALINYRDTTALLKKDKPKNYWDEQLDKLTTKRNLIVRDTVNKMARFIINRCLKDGIGNLVFGWNEGNKQNINNGRKNNYETVNMPTRRLIDRLEQLCQEYGIHFHVITEEYTSKSSFLDRDSLPKYGEKPNDWKPSGKRTTRDSYRTKDGLVIHADLNAAGNILRKLIAESKVQIDNYLSNIEGVLTNPAKYDVFRNLKKCFTTFVVQHVK